MTITSHLLLAILAVGFGFKNLLSKKGGLTHKIIGWIWVTLMMYVAVSSFWIKELNNGLYSWIHLLSIWVIISLTLSIYFIRKKKVFLHKIFMVGNFIGLTLAGIFTILPGRYIPETLGLY
ncbi:DUF2306 domain-containing protein [Candidatus Pelagibacter sp. HIMB1321]|jgi:uncharacterized membrane protein|uniref:DUF2306 domain-containing protein n=1 Tax=Candidatus Pelagibacter sp. HIMB1321 TaxID=1388755 RepID=UPI000A0819DC|nr:DUF2306 domain-containing protein [Candidatus Pelagibacter sp. HIMB1321]SMF78461.1 Uncharacterized membrane protein [Candidatus Pelagibacter sp. HIMB1321]